MASRRVRSLALRTGRVVIDAETADRARNPDERRRAHRSVEHSPDNEPTHRTRRRHSTADKRLSGYQVEFDSRLTEIKSFSLRAWSFRLPVRFHHH